MTRPYNHIVFDFDGTLVSSMDKVLDLAREVLSEYLGREVSNQEMTEKYNPSFISMFNNFGLTDENDHQNVVKRWQEVSHDRHFDYALFDGVEKLLSNLKDANFKLYIWTNRDRLSTLKIMEVLNILPYFHDIRTVTECAPKPHHEGILDLVGHWGPETCMMVGDSYTDIIPAHEFGCSSTAVTWCRFADEKTLKDFKPTYLSKTPADLEEVIINHFSKMMKG